MYLIRHSGTIVPLMVIIGALAAFVDQAMHGGKPTWELVVIYFVAAGSFPFGIYALSRMAQLSARRHPSFLLYSFLAQKVCNELLFLSAALIAYNNYISNYPQFPDIIVYPALVASVVATSVVNLVLWYGRKRGWLEAPVDPVPGRAFIEDYRDAHRD